MDYINTFVSGIVVFRIGRNYIYVKPSSAKDKTFADFFAQEQYDDALMDGIWTQKDVEDFLIERGYWSKEEEDKIKTIMDNIENMKVDYFNRFYDSDTKKYIKKNIDKQNQNINDLYNKKYLMYDKTCEYVKSYAFSSYMIQKNAYLKDGRLAYLYFSIQSLYNKYSLILKDINSNVRNLAKSDEWRYRWVSLKKSSFDNKPSSFTDFQLSIVSWSNYYDGIFKSYDRPSDEIIDDDIALDGWCIVEKRKRKEEEKKRNAEKILPQNLKDAGEIFIPVKNTKQAQDVMSLNNAEAKSRIKSLRKDLKREGIVEESQLTSTRKDLQMQAMQMRKNRR